MNELSGDYVEQVILPDSVHELCSYAFYNCRKLKCIEFGRSLDIVNNDAFMNCMGLSVLMVRSRAEEPTGAQYFLKQLNKGIELKYVLKAMKKSDLHIYSTWICRGKATGQGSFLTMGL